MRDILKPLLTSKRATQSANAGLWLDKFIGDQRRRDDRADQNEDESRARLVREVAGIRLPEEYKQHFARWQKALESQGGQCRKASVQGRMVVGLGGEGVLETSIMLHRTYGVPFIPGSALKGLAAKFAHLHLSDDWKLGGKFHRYTFGDTTIAGYVTFFDALLVPESGGGLLTDVLTVHHKDYYEGKDAPPADWDSPTPVPFLSAKGSYLVALSAPLGCDEWLAAAWLILETALRHSGIGAKTSSGYGRMELEKPSQDPDQQLADDLIRQIQSIPLNQVAGIIPQRAQELHQRQMSQAQKRRVAEAIIEMVKKAGREKAAAEKPWYKQLLESLKT
jgi:CRISPR-associated protein Cmr6